MRKLRIRVKLCKMVILTQIIDSQLLDFLPCTDQSSLCRTYSNGSMDYPWLAFVSTWFFKPLILHFRAMTYDQAHDNDKKTVHHFLFDAIEVNPFILWKITCLASVHMMWSNSCLLILITPSIFTQSLRGGVANVQDCDIEASKFELLSRYYIYFRTNTLGKAWNLLPTHPTNNYSLNNTNTVPLQGWLSH